MPWKLAFLTVNPVITTWLRPAWWWPSISNPFDSPVASTMLCPAPAPTIDTGFGTTTSSWYVPAATLMVSLIDAAATAALIRAKHPPVPPGLTHLVAPNASPDVPKKHAMNTRLDRRADFDLWSRVRHRMWLRRAATDRVCMISPAKFVSRVRRRAETAARRRAKPRK